MDSLSDAIKTLEGDAIDVLNVQISQMKNNILDLWHSFQDAFAADDIAAVNEFGAALQSALIDSFTAIIDMARQLEQTIKDLERQMRDWYLSLELTINDLVGVGSELRPVFMGLAQELIAAFNEASTAADKFAVLQEMLALVNQALAAARKAVQDWLDAELDLIREQEEALREQQDLIRESYQERIDALQEELQLAQQWAGILDQVTAAIDQMRGSSASPLPQSAQMAFLTARIDAIRQQMENATGAQRAELAQQLLGLLQQRIGLGQEMFQRPSEDYVALFNDTLREMNRIQEEAAEHAAKQEELQEKIASETEAMNAALKAIDDQLKALAAQAKALQEQANEKLAAIDAQAAKYYEWIQQEGARLLEEMKEAAEEQLMTLTNGLPLDEFEVKAYRWLVWYLKALYDAMSAFINGEKLPHVGKPPAEGFQRGTRYVAKDTLANVHAGEQIVQAGGRGAALSVSVPINVTMNGGDAKAGRMIARELRKEMRAVAPTVAREISRRAKYA